MGACTSATEKDGELKVNALIKVQALWKSYQAKKKLQRIKAEKLRTIFSIPHID